MTDKTMETIDIKGKKYTPVSERILFFNETYPNGKIESKLLTEPLSKLIVIQATVTPDVKNPDRYFTGFSQAVVGEGYINKTAALENCETSAWGRCLAAMGIGVLDSVASSDEIVKATNRENEPDPTDDWVEEAKDENDHFCEIHKIALKDRGQGVWDHRQKLNMETKKYDPNGSWHHCQGHGWKYSINQ